MTNEDILQVRLARAEARVEILGKLVARFWKLTPDDIKAPDGRTFQFVDPNPHLTLRIIRDAMNEALAQPEFQQRCEYSDMAEAAP